MGKETHLREYKKAFNSVGRGCESTSLKLIVACARFACQEILIQNREINSHSLINTVKCKVALQSQSLQISYKRCMPLMEFPQIMFYHKSFFSYRVVSFGFHCSWHNHVFFKLYFLVMLSIGTQPPISQSSRVIF